MVTEGEVTLMTLWIDLGEKLSYDLEGNLHTCLTHLWLQGFQRVFDHVHDIGCDLEERAFTFLRESVLIFDLHLTSRVIFDGHLITSLVE